jgi:glycosyltransferase involved in cell wall biosynthesis
MERAMYELIRGGHQQVDFTVVSITLAPELRPFVHWRRVPAPRRPFVLKYLTFFLLAALRWRRRDADLVHVLGAIVPRRVDVMAVHFCHAAYRADTVGADLEAGQRWLRRLNVGVAFRLGLVTERIFTRPPWVRTATAVSVGGARELASYYPRLAVTVIPNGVDQSRFRPAPDAHDSVRAECGVRPDEVVALFVGGRWTQKGLELAIRGLARANAAGTVPLVLWVAGLGDPARYKAVAAELGAGDRVRFLGYVGEAERLYQGADIFVLPSSYETFCMVAYEAASSGLPIVSTSVNGVDELLQDGSAGLMVAATEQAVGDALHRLAGDPGLRDRMGSAGRARVRDVTWSATVDQTVALYAELTGRSAPRGSR